MFFKGIISKAIMPPYCFAKLEPQTCSNNVILQSIDSGRRKKSSEFKKKIANYDVFLSTSQFVHYCEGTHMRKLV